MCHFCQVKCNDNYEGMCKFTSLSRKRKQHCMVGVGGHCTFLKLTDAEQKQNEKILAGEN